MKRGNWKSAKARKQDYARCKHGGPPGGSMPSLAWPVYSQAEASILARILPFLFKRKHRGQEL